MRQNESEKKRAVRENKIVPLNSSPRLIDGLAVAKANDCTGDYSTYFSLQIITRRFGLVKPFYPNSQKNFL